MTSSGDARHAYLDSKTKTARIAKVLTESTGLLRGPQRVAPLLQKLISDKLRVSFEQRHLYSYASTKRSSEETLRALLRWMLHAQRRDGGIAAYYSLLTGYSESYPEVTGYIVPTLYDLGRETGDERSAVAAERATRWLLALQMPSGAFPGGLHGVFHGNEALPSVFNTGQILQGLVRAYAETRRSEILQAAVLPAIGWSRCSSQMGRGLAPALIKERRTPTTAWLHGRWRNYLCAPGTINTAMQRKRNLNWVLSHWKPSGWFDGISLRGHPNYLHFIAYVLQGVLECSRLRRRDDAMQKVAKSAWILLRRFENNKYLPGAFENDFKGRAQFTCLTGNAQMACVWLRLFEMTDDLRYLNAALKMNEMLKRSISTAGRRGIDGGVSGSYPVWGAYQPLRYISWGCKFFADALMLEQQLTRSLRAVDVGALPCAS